MLYFFSISKQTRVNRVERSKVRVCCWFNVSNETEQKCVRVIASETALGEGENRQEQTRRNKKRYKISLKLNSNLWALIFLALLSRLFAQFFFLSFRRTHRDTRDWGNACAKKSMRCDIHLSKAAFNLFLSPICCFFSCVVSQISCFLFAQYRVINRTKRKDINNWTKINGSRRYEASREKRKGGKRKL